MDEERQRQLVDAFANNFLLGQGFTTITAARRRGDPERTRETWHAACQKSGRIGGTWANANRPHHCPRG